MSWETFTRAHTLSTHIGDEWLNFLGGEPFLHKDVLQQIQRLLWQDVNLRIVTNGSWVLTKNGNLTRLFHDFRDLIQDNFYEERISMMVSDDWWHDEFHKHYIGDVKQTLKSTGIEIEEDNRKINNYVIPLGRAAKTGVGQWSHRDSEAECVNGMDLSVMPNGDICACCNSQGVIANINDYWDVKDVYQKCHDNWQKIYYEKEITCGDCLTCKKWTKRKLDELQ